MASFSIDVGTLSENATLPASLEAGITSIPYVVSSSTSFITLSVGASTTMVFDSILSTASATLTCYDPAIVSHSSCPADWPHVTSNIVEATPLRSSTAQSPTTTLQTQASSTPGPSAGEATATTAASKQEQTHAVAVAAGLSAPALAIAIGMAVFLLARKFRPFKRHRGQRDRVVDVALLDEAPESNCWSPSNFFALRPKELEGSEIQVAVEAGAGQRTPEQSQESENSC